MIELVFATNNENKVKEIKAAVGKGFNIISLQDAGIDINIPEPHNNLTDNAAEKSKTIYNLTKKNCFGEDTGLEVTALNGDPGVLSARYAGKHENSEANIKKLLQKLKGKAYRNARFRTVISLIYNGKSYLFEGICEGTITHLQKGNSGFGYDPVFTPTGSNKTFAEMDMNEKNKYSHRKKAMQQLIHFLTEEPI